MNKKISLRDLQQQIGELTQALQRERADSENLHRRTGEEKAKMADFYKSQILQELLPALDNLERALVYVPKDLKNHDYVKGVQSIAKQFDSALTQLGVERIKTVGEHFDPHLHEAAHLDEGEGEHEIVSEELQPGYKIGDEVVRSAMVKVKKEKR